MVYNGDVREAILAYLNRAGGRTCTEITQHLFPEFKNRKYRECADLRSALHTVGKALHILKANNIIHSQKIRFNQTLWFIIQQRMI